MMPSLLLFLPFLPQWAQVCLSVFTGLGGVGSVLALLKVRKEKQDFLIQQATQKAKEEKDLEARLKDYKEFKEKYALDRENTQERLTGLNLFIEKVGNEGKQECDALKEKFSTVHNLSHEVNKIQTSLQSTDRSVEKLDRKIDDNNRDTNVKLDRLQEKMDDNSQIFNDKLDNLILLMGNFSPLPRTTLRKGNHS